MISIRYITYSFQVLSMFPVFFKIKLFVLPRLGLAVNEKRGYSPFFPEVSDSSRIRARK